MASADLDHIRALLIAQTAEPEPEPRGWFGRRRRPAPREPLSLGGTGPKPRFVPPAFSDPDQELLLQKICGPPSPMAEVDEDLFEPRPDDSLGVETASPLPPPAPRTAFGRRADEPEAELVLETPAVELRRLRVLDPTGAAIGEMILHPRDQPMRLVSPMHDDEHAAPFFPEDFGEPGGFGQSPGEPQPMRPWIKALRNASRPKSASAAAETAPDPVEEAAPLAKRVRRRRAVRQGPPTGGASPRPSTSFAHDLLDALALALDHEHVQFADRLATVLLYPLPVVEAASDAA